MSPTVLITGGAGFIGSRIALTLKERSPQTRVIVLDNLSRRGSELNVPRLKSAKVRFVKGDVRRPRDLEFKGTKIDYLIECSSEPSVLAAYSDSPQYTIDTNLTGAVNCLELARRKKSGFIFLSTSRVYPVERLNAVRLKKAAKRFEISLRQAMPGISRKGVNEKFPLDGWRSFYGASKLAAELMIEEYRQAYGIKTVINRCGVVSGPWQMGKEDQGVFGLWMLNHFFKRKLSYIGFGGRGLQVRDVLHVDDLVRLIILQMKSLNKLDGSVFNAGGGAANALSLRETTEICRYLTGEKFIVGSVKTTRTADVPLYVTDNTLVTRKTGWKPRLNAADVMKDLYQWVRENEKVLYRKLIKS